MNEQWEQLWSGTGTTATITGLTPDTEYEFRLKATNTAGESAWVTVTVKTKIKETVTRIIRLAKSEAFTPETEGFVTLG